MCVISKIVEIIPRLIRCAATRPAQRTTPAPSVRSHPRRRGSHCRDHNEITGEGEEKRERERERKREREAETGITGERERNKRASEDERESERGK